MHNLVYKVASERLNDIKKNNFYKHMFFKFFIIFVFQTLHSSSGHPL